MSHAPVRSSSCSVSLLGSDGDQNLGDDLVNDAKIRPSDTNDCPPVAFKVALPTLLGLNAVVDFIDRVPVLDATIELDSYLQVGQRNIDEVRVAGYVDLFLSRYSFDPRAQQGKQHEGLARRLASSVGTVNDPSGLLAPDGVEGSVSQCLVELFACLLLAGTRLILTKTVEMARVGQPRAGNGKPVLVGQQAGAINDNSRRCGDLEAQVLDSWNRMAWPACADCSSGNSSSIRSYNMRKCDLSCAIKAVCVHEQILQAARGR